MKKFIIIILIISVFHVFANNRLALYNCTIIDGNGGRPILNGVILVNGTIIENIGNIEKVKIPDGYEKINLNGMYLLPGLINAHVHNAYNETNLKEFLKSGLTTIRDIGPFDKNNFLKKRDSFNKNSNYARIISGTPLISAPGGYGYVYVESPEDASRVIKDYINQNVDIIKIAIEDNLQGRQWPLLSYNVIKTIVDTAHLNGKKVSAHISHARNLKLAVDAGVNDLAHMIIDNLTDEQILSVVKKNIYWVPTLELWYRVSNEYGQSFINIAINNLKKFYKAGGKIALGTDYSGYHYTFDYFPLIENQQMKKASMSNMDIIIAATKNASIVCDIDKKIGTLEIGKIADIIGVIKNPLDNIENLKNIKLIIHNGMIIKN